MLIVFIYMILNKQNLSRIIDIVENLPSEQKSAKKYIKGKRYRGKSNQFFKKQYNPRLKIDLIKWRYWWRQRLVFYLLLKKLIWNIDITNTKMADYSTVVVQKSYLSEKERYLVLDKPNKTYLDNILTIFFPFLVVNFSKHTIK